MLKITTIIFICICSVSAFSQETPVILTGKESPKELRRLEKLKDKDVSRRQKAKANEHKQEKRNQLAMLDADLDEVGKFPQDYVGHKVRFKFVTITDIRNYTENDQTLYLIGLTSRKGADFYSLLASGELSFVMDANLAKQFYSYAKENEVISGSRVPAHITAEIKSLKNSNNQTVFIGKVLCIEGVSIIGVKFKSIGECL